MQSNLTASQRLASGRDQVLRIWESGSRRIIASARNKDSHTVQNELAHFIAALVANLRVGHPDSVEKERVSAEHHGQQRAGLTGYTLMETIKEYALLRQVIIEFLLAGGPLSETERTVIHQTVDNAIQLASNEFAQAEQAKIKLALAKANSSNHDLEQFAAVAAHDLRSPLNSIAGFTELLQMEFGEHASADAREWMTFIRNAVQRMTGLIDGILSYAKLNQLNHEMKLISAEEPVKAATQNLKGALTQSSGRIGHEKLPFVIGNLPLLTQLFQNLFANAIRYRGEKPPEVEVSVRLDGDHWRFCVADNGVGFDMKYKDVVFEVHKQLDTDQRFDGAGLGLATCRRVVESHGGKIWVESEPAKGSKFYFTLPRATTREKDGAGGVA